MKVDLFLVKDNDGNISNNFHSLHLAKEFASYTKGFIERIEVTVPGKREVKHVENKEYPVFTETKTLTDIENDYILHVLNNICNRNKTHTANILGISLKGLHNRLAKLKGNK